MDSKSCFIDKTEMNTHFIVEDGPFNVNLGTGER